MRRLVLALALSTAAAVISAAIPSAVAQDADSRFIFRHRPIVFEIKAPPAEEAPTWETSAALPGGTEGEAWSAVLTATHVNGDVTYAFVGDAPGWLGLNMLSGQLAGTPHSAGIHEFTVRAATPSGSHANRTFTVAVEEGPDVAPPVWQTAPSLPGDSAGQLWSATVTATDDRGSVTYSLLPGAPGWLSLNPATGQLSGTPAIPGPYAVTVRATDEAGNHADRIFSFTTADVAPPVWHTAASLPDAALGEAWSAVVTAFDDSGSVTYTLLQDAPGWLSLHPQTGTLSGIPDAAGVFTFVVRASDPTGNHADRTFAVEVKAPPAFVAVSAGNSHTCAVRTDGSAWCWGTGSVGRLGNGGTANSTVPVPVSGGHVLTTISVGTSHTCAVRADGSAWCWGGGSVGRLGNGGTANSTVPVPVSGGHAFAAVSANNAHTCAVGTDGSAWCWGGGTNGRLGNGGTAESNVPVPVSGGHAFVTVSAGNGHSCGVTTNGSAWCWGTGTNGRLGNGGIANSTVPVPVSGGHAFAAVSVGGTHACGLDEEGSAWCWGAGGSGRLGNGGTADSNVPAPVSGGHVFVTIAVGTGHSCGVKTNGSAWCWGVGSSGQHGNGATGDSSVPVQVSGGHVFTDIAAADTHTCGVKTNGSAWCWGAGGSGQLGNGGTANSTIPVQVPN